MIPCRCFGLAPKHAVQKPLGRMGRRILPVKGFLTFKQAMGNEPERTIRRRTCLLQEGGTRMAESVLLVERADRVATVTLNRPRSMNALSLELRRALADTFAQFGRTRPFMWSS